MTIASEAAEHEAARLSRLRDRLEWGILERVKAMAKIVARLRAISSFS